MSAQLKLPSSIDPEMWERLTPDEQNEYLSCMETLVGGVGIVEWIERWFPEEPPPDHVMPIIEAVEQARVKPVRLVISYGPGHAKTTTLLRCLVWWLHRAPKDQCIYATYSSGHAHDKSRIARQYAEDTGLALMQDSKSVGHWRTEAGGGLIAVGARGKITGQRVPGLFVVDDPYKDEFEARSPAINHQVKERFKATAFTRLQGGSAIVLHTRWAEDDLVGWLSRDLKWDCINVPTVCDEQPDILGRKMDEEAWPEKYPYEICTTPCGHDGHLKEIRETIGEHLWASMYQGRPRPLGTAVFHEPARFSLKDFKWEWKRGVISIDPAATAKTSADWSVIMQIAMEGYGADTRSWIVDVVRLQAEIPDLVNRARRIQLATRLMIACEAVGGFKGVPQMLRAMDAIDPVTKQPMGKLRVIDVNPGQKDKFARAQPGASAWNGGRVMVPVDAPWADGLIERFQRFTGINDREDDEIDAFGQGFNILYRSKKPERMGVYEGGGL